jgi:pyruvate,orthophosphate dikinase
MSRKASSSNDPFVTLDIDGVGELVRIASERAGQPGPTSSSASAASTAAIRPRSFCEQIGLDYVSCSPFRVPIARLAGGPGGDRENPHCLTRARRQTRRRGRREGKSVTGDSGPIFRNFGEE